MNLSNKILQNEEGGTLLISVLVLLLLLILGIVISKTSRMDIRMASNENQYRRAFYNADSGISYGVERVRTLMANIPGGIIENDWRTVNATNLAGVPSNVRFRMRVRKPATPMVVELEANSTFQKSAVAIIGGIELVTPGAQQGPGSQTTYASD